MKKIGFIVICFFTLQLQAQVKVIVHLDSSIHESVSGRLYVYTNPDTSRWAPKEADAFFPTPMFTMQVSNWNNSQSVTIDQTATGYPSNINQLTPGYYKITGVLDRDMMQRGSLNQGNFYVKKDVLLYVDKNGNGVADIYLNAVVGKKKFVDTDSVKEVVIKSEIISSFWKKDMFIKAAVKLPPAYFTDTKRKFPVVFIIPGWGGTHYDLQTDFPAKRYGMGMGKDKIYVYLNSESQMPFGFHAFVDSRVNGAWGKALVEELAPYLTANYRVTENTLEHFVVGQSTGGYGALWLQLHYPKSFGGCWAVSPDPVDFSNFLGVNLYAKNANFYFDESGKERPFFILEGKAQGTIKKFVGIETFIGDGEQIQSFEAEFGVLGKDKKPRQVFNRETGLVNKKVFKTWQRYDMGKFIQHNWKQLESVLENKVHVYAGEDDNFFLQEAVKIFGEKAKAVGATTVIAELFPKSDHFSIWKPAFTARVQAEIDARIK